MKLRQRAAVALATAATTVGVAGCSAFSPAVVLRPYDASDGRNTRVAGVEVRNALVVSPGLDEPGVVSVTLVNSSAEDASVTVSADLEAGDAPVQTYFVPAGELVQVGATQALALDGAETTPVPGEQNPAWLQLAQVPQHPGETVTMTFRAAGESAEVDAPVVLPCFEYAELTPTPAPGATAAPAPEVQCGAETDDSLQQADDEGEEEAATTGGDEQDTTGPGADTQSGPESGSGAAPTGGTAGQ
ncbi:hypothetical protein [Kineococcus gypseus]|uniref:hypothetical protein n=1 Tax=Kineococcus gypseus TaxID=1637102 RepID=UPI003D7E3140